MSGPDPLCRISFNKENKEREDAKIFRRLVATEREKESRDEIFKNTQGHRNERRSEGLHRPLYLVFTNSRFHLRLVGGGHLKSWRVDIFPYEAISFKFCHIFIALKN